LTWGVPALIALLLAGVLLGRGARGNPVEWAQRQVDRVSQVLGELGNRLRPDITITTISIDADDDDPLLSQVPQSGLAGAGNQNVALAMPLPGEVVSDTLTVEAPVVAPEGAGAPADAGAIATAAPETPAATATSEPPTAVPATATPEATATQPPTPTNTATPAPTNTPPNTPTTTATPATIAASATNTNTTGLLRGTAGRATPTPAALTAGAVAAVSETISSSVSLQLTLPTPTPTTAETPTPAPTATPTVPLVIHTVRAGDTLFDIARSNDLTVDELLAANGLTEADAFTIQPGDELIISGAPPVPTATPVPPTPTPEPAMQTYTVAPGDTMMAIALRTRTTIDELLAANGMTINQARALRPGDTLRIPGTGDTLPTSTPGATATALPAATPAIASSTIRLDAPQLRSPEDNTSVSCSVETYLNWQPVASIRGTDLYVVHLGYVNGVTTDGTEELVWVLAQQHPANSTSWRMDNRLCGLAPLAAGRQWRWFVEVAEKTGDTLQPVSPPSAMWRFSWQ
jgi:LysM repeat protein